jgi:hypothetical protein
MAIVDPGDSDILQEDNENWWTACACKPKDVHEDMLELLVYDEKFSLYFCFNIKTKFINYFYLSISINI